MALIVDDFPHWPQIASIAGLICTLIWLSYHHWGPRKPWPGFPLISIDGLTPQASWDEDAEATLDKGQEITKDGFFQVMTGNGPKIIAPNRFLDELKGDNATFNVHMAFSEENFWSYSGMNGFRAMREHSEVIRHVVRGKATAAMFAITGELALETESIIREQIAGVSDDQWHSVAMHPVCEEIITRLSTLLFLGREASRDRGWLDMMKSYAANGFSTAARLRASHPLARWLGHRFFFKQSNVVRAQYAEATARIEPMVQDRLRLIAAGEYKSLKVGDTLGWLLEASSRYKRPVDCVGSELLLALASIYSTTGALNFALLDTCRHPEVVQPLRDELREVLAEHGGWNKNAVSNLHLMDSFLEESQRLSPASIYPFRRIATRNVVLSDGTKVPKGAFVTVTGRNRDGSVFADPKAFHLRRFLAEPGQKSDKTKYAGQSPDMVQFGYGEHVCAGKQIAATELKIALGHLLMMYDWTLDPSQRYVNTRGGVRVASPTARLRVRRHDELGQEASM